MFLAKGLPFLLYGIDDSIHDGVCTICTRSSIRVIASSTGATDLRIGYWSRATSSFWGGGRSCHDFELLSNQRPLDCQFLMLRRCCSLLIFHRKTSRRFSPIGSDQKRVRYDLFLPLPDPANQSLKCAGHRRGLSQHVMPNAPDRASTDPLVWIDCEVGHC